MNSIQIPEETGIEGKDYYLLISSYPFQYYARCVVCFHQFEWYTGDHILRLSFFNICPVENCGIDKSGADHTHLDTELDCLRKKRCG